MDKITEFSAATADEAIEKGLEILGKTRDQVDVDILDSGAKGLFGLGSRPARVRLTGKETGASAADFHAFGDKDDSNDLEQIEDVSDELDDLARLDLDETADYKHWLDDEEDEESNGPVNEEALKTTISVVNELIEKMRIKATVSGRIGTLESSGDQPMILIDIKGDDLSYLIGRHSETLNAFQYITSLIVGRELGHWIPMMIDVQGYRERREKQLRQMATRMASQVIKSGRRISLEPMPGTERRIIHLVLRDRDDVYTESVGEEPNRKVVIYPKD